MKKLILFMLGALIVFGACSSEPVIIDADDSVIVEDDGLDGALEDLEALEGEDSSQPDELSDAKTSGDEKELTVSFVGGSVVPSRLVVSRGDTVVFVNNRDKRVWPASAVHPTHQSYPGSGIHLCGKEVVFDSCRDLNPSEEFTFTFDQVGTWEFHDHLNPSVGGSIVVE